MLISVFLFAIVISSSQYDIYKQKRHYHDHGSRSEKHMPSFLKEVSSQSRKDFFEIVHDRKSPRSEVQQRVKEWAEKQGGGVLEDLRNFDAKKKAHFAEVHRNVSLVISQLESAHAKVHKILVDDSLSKEQMFEQLRNLDIDPAVSRALRAVIFAVGHPHLRKPYGKHNHQKHGSKNDTESPTYQGLVGLAEVLDHAEKDENTAPFGKNKDDSYYK